MGMSTEEFEKQKADKSRRYYIDTVPDGSFGYRIMDRTTGGEVGRDGGEPEDQLLVRDWAWVVDALNDRTDVAALARTQRERDEAKVEHFNEGIDAALNVVDRPHHPTHESVYLGTTIRALRREPKPAEPKNPNHPEPRRTPETHTDEGDLVDEVRIALAGQCACTYGDCAHGEIRRLFEERRPTSEAVKLAPDQCGCGHMRHSHNGALYACTCCGCNKYRGSK